MSDFSDFIVYVDESGDHCLTKIESEFPVFVLSFCLFRKADYINRIVPALQQIKFKHFGHDMIVFHERDIRKASGPFVYLTDTRRREEFMADMNAWVESSPFVIIAIVIRKSEFVQKHASFRNPYHFAMQLGLERVKKYLRRHEPANRTTHIVFEARGRREDDDLELEFRRVCDGANFKRQSLNFQMISAEKQVNSTGLQLADLTARPIGRHVMNPIQSNRAYDLILTKLDRGKTGEVEGYGLKSYP